MILRQNIPEFYQVRFAMDPTLSKHFLRWILLCPNTFCDGSYFVLSKHFLRWILLCPNTFCDGSYFVQTLFAMDPTLSKHFLRWILLCPVQTLFAMDPTLSKHFLRWILLCPNTFCDGSYFVQTLFAMEPTQIHLKTLQVRLTGNQGLVSNNLGDFVPSVSKL